MTSSNVVITMDCALGLGAPGPVAIELPQPATGRDLHIKISTMTNLSRSRRQFKLFHNSKQVEIPDTLLPLAESGISSGARIPLVTNILTGQLSTNFEQIDPAQKAIIRQYVYSLPPSTIQRFFNADETLILRIPIMHTWATLKFRLDKPMTEDSIPPLETGTYKEQSVIHRVRKRDERTLAGRFNGGLPEYLFDSQGIPSRTVDTVVSILDNLLDSAGL
jgi:hypothetical protein